MIFKWAPALVCSIILSVAIKARVYTCIVVKKGLISSTRIASRAEGKVITLQTGIVACDTPRLIGDQAEIVGEISVVILIACLGAFNIAFMVFGVQVIPHIDITE